MNEKEKREYYIVDKRILPNSIQSVIKVNDLVQHSKISKYEAIKKVGISRSTYYKYKDFNFAGIFAVIVGALIGIFIPWGIKPLNSLVSAGIVFIILDNMLNKKNS